MKSFATAAVVFACAGLAIPAMAADPTGTWKSTTNFHNQQLENILSLRLDSEGPTLTGDSSDTLGNREAPIVQASFKNGNVSFLVVREVSGQRFTIRYSGKLSGDTIIGRTNIDYGDRTQSSEWVAKRQR